MTSGYGERGIRAGVSVSIDFGDLILPGIVTAEIDAHLAGSSTIYDLIILQRFPREVTSGWSTVTPICLYNLVGKARRIEAGVSASIGVGVNASVGEFGLKADLGASLEANLMGQVMRLNHHYMKAHQDTSDPGLASTVFDLLSDALPAVIQEWIAQVLYEQNPDRDKSLDWGKEETKKSIKASIMTWLNSVLAGIEVSDIKNLLEQDMSKKGAIEAAKKALVQLQGLLEKKFSVDDGVRYGEDEDPNPVRIEQLRLCRLLLGHLNEMNKQPERASKPPDDGQWPANHLDLLAGQVTGSASAEGKASVNIKLVEAGAEASAGVDGRVNLLSYRLQTRCPGRGVIAPLVMTQDTIITYRQVKAKAEAKAEVNAHLDLHPAEEEALRQLKVSEEATYYYRTMTYYSVIAYWTPPGIGKGVKARKLAKTHSVFCHEGSGIVWGASVQLSRLVDLIKALGKAEAPDDKSKKLLTNLSHSLHVSVETLRKFLSEVKILTDSDPAQFKTSTLLLEAGFSIVDKSGFREITGGTLTKSVGFKLPNLLKDEGIKSILERAEAQPDVLRLRYRLSDRWDRTDSVFKLGFSKFLGLEISIERIKEAGHEGVIDLAVWFRAEGSSITTDYEHNVPPVALLHN